MPIPSDLSPNELDRCRTLPRPDAVCASDRCALTAALRSRVPRAELLKHLVTVAFAALVASAAIGASACGPVQPACGPGTCRGCCDSEGVCQTGIDDASCGTSGEQCKACATVGAGMVCNLGFCVTPQQCAGCTDAQGHCLSGVDDSACGGGGAACKACEANETCANRACQKVCKDLNAACVSGSECCSGRCGVFGLCAEPIADGGPDDGGMDGGTDGGFDGGDDGGRDGGDGGVCGPECSVQGPMDPSCSPCAASVCSSDAYCCNTAWDSACVGEAEKACGLSCGGFDGGPFDGGPFDGGPFDGGPFDGGPFTDGGAPVCGPECVPQFAPMDPSCSPCVATVCSSDSYCCNVEWDNVCAGEAQQSCGLSCGFGDGGFVDGGFSDGGGAPDAGLPPPPPPLDAGPPQIDAGP